MRMRRSRRAPLRRERLFQRARAAIDTCQHSRQTGRDDDETLSGTSARGATTGGQLRVDGRSADQMRALKITPDFISTAEGSVLIELGKTRVICTATVDDGVPGFLK